MVIVWHSYCVIENEEYRTGSSEQRENGTRNYYHKKGRGEDMSALSTANSLHTRNHNSREGEMQNLVMRMAQALVDNPQMVDFKEFREGRITVLTLRVSKEDVGKVIGKKGNTVSAMRTILQAASVKNNTKTLLEVME